MHSHHQEALERIKHSFETEQDVIALILTGSVARGEARSDSDIDLVAVVTDEDYKHRMTLHDLTADLSQFANYENGQASCVYVPIKFLQDAVEKADERERFHFVKAKVIFTSLPEIDELISKIAVYPEHERGEKMMSFRSQLPVHLAYFKLAVYSKNSYLLAETASKLVLFGGRLILAHNYMLYPGRKWFMLEFAAAPDKPESLIELVDSLLAEPTIEKGQQFHDTIIGFRDWPEPPGGYWMRYREDIEWTWRNGASPIAEK